MRKLVCVLCMASSALLFAKKYTVTAGGLSLQDAVSQAVSGDTIIIEGEVQSGTILLDKDGLTFKGKKNAAVDFTPTFAGADMELLKKCIDEVENGEKHVKLTKSKDESVKALKKILDAGHGFEVTGSSNVFTGFVIKNAADNGVYVTGSNNVFKKMEFCYNHDSGVQVCNGGANNRFIDCYSHDNVDEWNGGENADGFAAKLDCGEGNYFENCRAEYNGDDGWDLLGAHGSVTLKKCRADYSGLDRSGKRLGYYSNGNGFKLGGLHNVDDYPVSKTLHHTLTGCSATGNYKSGYACNNQFGTVTLTKCSADSNQLDNFHWPNEGSPSVLVKGGIIQKGEKVRYGDLVMNACETKNGANDIGGAILDSKCRGFTDAEIAASRTK